MLRIVQCLCPARHCILAMPYETPDGEARPAAAELLREEVDRLIATGIFNGGCGLCGAPRATWRFEDAKTRYRTLDEALPSLRASERAQAETRVAWKMMMN
jgi:hypothetical protein